MEECPPLPGGDPQLLVFGGSRGARAINQTVVAALPHLAPLQGKLRIRHQTGEEDLQATREGYLRAGWEPSGVVPFINDMADAYAQAHLVVCRAGATTIAELTACGRPAILIPYPYAAADHQSANARALARRGAGLMIPQQELSAEMLGRLVGDLLADRERLEMMARVSHSIALRGAADRILAECRAIMHER
jgi:UDP-N-acetylglucosamine--N-acetylmuramyl-(pentapeptide) pyrophosphoryl-undecaprenol N-acetylglucosamine transferase